MSRPKQVTLFLLLCLLALATGFGLAQLDMRRNAAPETSNQPTTLADKTAKDDLVFQGEDGKTALELLQERAEVRTKTTANGDIVEAVNGQEAADEKTWLYYVNGQQAQAMPDKYMTKDDDTIEWRLE